RGAAPARRRALASPRRARRPLRGRAQSPERRPRARARGTGRPQPRARCDRADNRGGSAVVSGLVVLAVDDEPRALADVQRILSASPRVSRVDAAGGGRDALLKLGEGSYDALLLDVRMPEIEGIELARLLRRFDDPPEVVFLTGH